MAAVANEGRPSKKRKAPDQQQVAVLPPAPWLHVDEHVSLKSASPVLGPAASPFSPSLQGLRGPLLSDGSLVRLEASSSAKKKAKLVAQEKNSVQQKRIKTASAAPAKEAARCTKEKTATSAGPCDRCDGPHESSQCPIFKKPRENHPDALRRKPIEIGKAAGNFVLRAASVVRQPGDGSCLFHSLNYGYRGGGGANSLRREIAQWVYNHPNLRIADTPVKEWVRWDSNLSVQNYANRMARGGWGGGIEMAAFSRLKKVNVHVFERKRGDYKRISVFEVPGASKTVHVLYQGGVHYDALVPKGPLVKGPPSPKVGGYSPGMRGMSHVSSPSVVGKKPKHRHRGQGHQFKGKRGKGRRPRW